MNQLGLQFTPAGLQVAGLTMPYLPLSLELFLVGLLVILEVVLLLRLKCRAPRTNHRQEQTQGVTRSGGNKEGVHHRTDARERQHIQQRQAGLLEASAPAAQKIATPTDQRLADLFCPHCGQLTPAGATFCSHCGALLVASELGHVKLPPSAHPETPPAQQVLDPQARSSGDGHRAPGMSGMEHRDVARPRSSGGAQPAPGLAVGARSHPGIKRQDRPNEDSLFAARGRGLHGSQPCGVFLVADGMGGHAYGQEASRQAIQTLIDELLPQVSASRELGESDLKHLLIDAVQAANQVIHQRNQEQGTDMGTTITAAVVVDSTAFVANVGDSRTYLYREPGGLRKITNDHSVVAYLVETGIIKPDAIYTHAQRNRIYRSLGTKPMLLVDVFVERLQPGDTLLLCSDGLWEMVRDPLIEQILRNGTDPSQTSSALIEAALGGGGADNISVIVVQVTEATRQTGLVGLQLFAKPDAVEIPNVLYSEPKQSSQA